MNVFISDDSPIVRVRLAHIFDEVKGINIIGEAKNVQESIDLINQLKPDVVILDISMPGGSGIDVLKNIKNNNHSIKVIILTNYPYPQYKKICMDNGADYFLDKSNEFNKVVDIFKEI
ncbi:MAG: response regulator transcription factor [Ignavibacteriales bacterium]|nr:response regulator transcription factor [Ignavibacteriales bacterium]